MGAGGLSHKKVGKVSTMNFVPESISNVIQNVQNNPVKRANQRLTKNMGSELSSVLGKMHQSNPDKRKPVLLTLPSEELRESANESHEDLQLDLKMMTPKRPPKSGSNTSRASRKQGRQQKNTSRQSTPQGRKRGDNSKEKGGGIQETYQIKTLNQFLTNSKLSVSELNTNTKR